MPDFVYRTLARLQAHSPTSVPNLKKIGENVGFGTEGFVYRYGSERVLKVATFGFHNPQVAIERIKFVLHRPRKQVVKIYSCGIIDNIYWYEMEELRPLSMEESNIFYEVFENHDAFMADPTVRWRLRIDKKKRKSRAHRKMLRFLRETQKLPLLHHDLHDGNIMKTSKGQYKLIDVESICDRKVSNGYLGYGNQRSELDTSGITG